MNSDDYDDPAIEAAWLAEQRGNVQRYDLLMRRAQIIDERVQDATLWR